ncbi:Pentatricopeptide repeat-containing protein [Platanthera guangdongensis]|uniref:Pentatricopeptide repeat-containing protein n=1 Tax=Platanthera guangdongensis TaxID=2320717 RepID=A0ABR2LZ58_9ASPA
MPRLINTQCSVPFHLLRLYLLKRGSHCTPDHERYLISLLRHHHLRRPSLQLHSHLVTSALHRHHVSRRGILLWNTLIYRYSLGSFPFESLQIYQHMLSFCTSDLPTDSFTFSFLIKACSSSASSPSAAGLQLHSLVLKNGFAFHIYVHTALLGMYSARGAISDACKAFNEIPAKNSVSWNAMVTGLAKWGEMEMAKSLFVRMPNPNVISWTGLIDGYTRVRNSEKALSLFRGMATHGICPSEITVLAVIPAIFHLGGLDMGETLHAYCVKFGFDLLDVRVENSLIDMYARCGSVENAVLKFEEMRERRNLVSWTSILTCFGMHGMAEEAVLIFERMGRENMKPNRVTFLSLLSACSHSGLVEEGVRFFRLMVDEHGVEPETKHYSCLIDMLGRTGRLAEAEEMIGRMPVEVNVIVWRTLLGCCSKHGEVEMAWRVMRRIMELERGYGGDYVVLSNLLTEVGRFGEAETVRRFLDENNAVKATGLSLT